MASYTVIHEKAEALYDTFERKADLQHQTHYCPGCGHGIVTKLLAQAIDELGVRERTVLISPVGCSVFGYYYFDVGNVRSEEHTSELQSLRHLVCRLLLEKKK